MNANIFTSNFFLKITKLSWELRIPKAHPLKYIFLTWTLGSCWLHQVLASPITYNWPKWPSLGLYNICKTLINSTDALNFGAKLFMVLFSSVSLIDWKLPETYHIILSSKLLLDRSTCYCLHDTYVAFPSVFYGLFCLDISDLCLFRFDACWVQASDLTFIINVFSSPDFASNGVHCMLLYIAFLEVSVPHFPIILTSCHNVSRRYVMPASTCENTWKNLIKVSRYTRLWREY